MREILVPLDDRIAERLRAVAAADGLAEGAWVARRVEEALHSLWPEALRALAGAWADEPPPRPEALRARRGDDARRHPALRRRGAAEFAAEVAPEADPERQS